MVTESNPKVSVVMTVFNREDFLAEAIESVLHSSFTDFEFIIVDDQSSDSSRAIIKRYATMDNRIRFAFNEKNLGDYPNRRYAASLAKGEYIKFLDSDDILYSHGLEVMVRGMEKFPEAGLGMVWGLPIFEPSPHLITSRDAYHMFFFEGKWLQVGPSGSIYKRKAYEEVGGFSGLNYAGDVELNLKLAARWPVVRLQTDLFFYRIHSGQELQRGNSSVYGYPTLNHKVQLASLKDLFCPMNEEEKMIAMRNMNILQSRRIFRSFIKRWRLKELIDVIRESGLGWSNFFSGIFTFNQKFPKIFPAQK